jgi:hypothetical protein
MPRAATMPPRLPAAEHRKRLNALLNLYEVYKDLVALYLRDISQSPGDMDVLYIRRLVPALRGLVEELHVAMPENYIPFDTLSHAGKTLRERSQTINETRENIYAAYGDLKKLATRMGAVGQEPIPNIEAIIVETSGLIARRIERGGSDDQPRVRLADQRITFDDDNALISVGGKRCPLPAYKYEHYFARVMWERLAGEPVSWDTIVEDVEREMGRQGIKEKALMDTMYRLNDRIKKVANTDDELFSRKSQNIIRNYG